jgi:anti-sigma factor RsiW
MTCSEFRKNLHAYIDESLEADQASAARAHLATCGECSHALQRAQSTGRAVQHALERATADLALTSHARENILLSAGASRIPSHNTHAFWRWAGVRPLRIITAAAALIALSLLVAHLRRSPTSQPARTPRVVYSIDVPIISEDFRGVIHAESAD